MVACIRIRGSTKRPLASYGRTSGGILRAACQRTTEIAAIKVAAFSFIRVQRNYILFAVLATVRIRDNDRPECNPVRHCVDCLYDRFGSGHCCGIFSAFWAEAVRYEVANNICSARRIRAGQAFTTMYRAVFFRGSPSRGGSFCPTKRSAHDFLRRIICEVRPVGSMRQTALGGVRLSLRLNQT